MPTFADLIDQGVIEIGDGYRAKNDELGGDGPIFLRAALVGDGCISFHAADRFRTHSHERFGNKVGRPGDTVITTKGNSTGRVAFVPEGAPTFVYSPHLSYWRSLDSTIVHPHFLRAWSRGREFREQLAALSGSTDMAPYMSLGDQRRLIITLPDIDDQRAACGALTCIDDKIDVNRRIGQTLETIADAVFRSRFVDFDDAGELVESEIGWIPRGWRVSALPELADFVNGGAFTKDANGTGRMIVRIAELNSGPGGSTKYGELSVPERHTAYPGDILFSWSGTLGLYRWFRDEAIINQHIFKVVPKEGWPAWFIWFCIQQHLEDFRATAASKATTMGHIKREHLTAARVAVPNDPGVVEQARVPLDPIWAQWLILRQEILNLTELRDSLLPRLISGELRVPVDVDTGEAA